MINTRMVLTVYLNKVLTPNLRHYGITPVGNKRILESIHDQMVSLLHHWNDTEFRNAVMFPSLEEAEFYGPTSKLETRQFVVTTIRNSLLQVGCTQNFRQVGLPKKLTNKDIMVVTTNAVRFFEDNDLKALADLYETAEVYDIYKDNADRYPVAFLALRQLAGSASKTVSYERCESKSIDLDMLKRCFRTQSPAPVPTIGGEIEELDPNLVHGMGDVLSGASDFFYTDSFKMISRSFPKLLYVLETLLENDKAVVTANCYISNGYAEKRKHMLKAAQTSAQAMSKIRETKGLGDKHRQALLFMLDNTEGI